MYTRIALGKNSAMDVVSGESSGGQGQLLILYPLLFALQLLEIWIGEHCVNACLRDDSASAGMLQYCCSSAQNAFMRTPHIKVAVATNCVDWQSKLAVLC